MDKHQSCSGEDEFELPVHESGEPLQQTSANDGVFTRANQERMAHSNYAPRPVVQYPPYITGSFPQNTAYSTYFLPPYQTASLQHPMPPYNMPITFVNQQSPIPGGFQQIAPKPPQAQNPTTVAHCSTSRPPDFIETVKQILKELYARGGIGEDESPPVLETKDHSEWRKDVIKRWKPHNMSHYSMVAKLSKKCFDLVLKIPQCLNRKVTQGDFIHLYNKSDDEQHKILSDLLNSRISLQDVKQAEEKLIVQYEVRFFKGRAGHLPTIKFQSQIFRRGKETVPREMEINKKELENENTRLKSQIVDLRIKLNQAIEDRDREKRRADRFQQRLRILEKENEDEFSQYRADVDNLVAEKNNLSLSFLHHSLPSDQDDKMSKTSSNKTSPSVTDDSDQPDGSSRKEIESDPDSEDNMPLSKLSKADCAERKAAERESSESSESSSLLEVSSSESENELITVAETIRKDARDLKNKHKKKTSRSDERRSSTPAKPPYPLPNKVAKERTRETYEDEWDYDHKKLNVNEWVAVAYKEGFYIGKVEKILSEKVRVNFLSKNKQGSFNWPRVQYQINKTLRPFSSSAAM